MSSVARWVVRAGTGLALASLALTLDNLRRVRVAVPLPRAAVVPEPVALLLPVRDEVDAVERCVVLLLRAARNWPGPARVLVLDDSSTDGTAPLLHGLAAQDELLEVVRGRPTPPGWLGKPWACAQLAEAAAGSTVLVFVDADVALSETAVVATVGLLRASGLSLVCPYPRQVARSAAERLVQPLLQWSWMSSLPLGAAERSPRPSLSAANGQLLAVDADAYRAAGGHRAVRGEVLEDIALLRAVKATGGRGGVADGTLVATCRMYDGWSDLRDGWTKSLWSAFGSPVGAAAALSLLLLTYVVPPLAALGGSRTGLLGYLAAVLSRMLVGHRTGARVHPDAWAHPASVTMLAVLTVDSLVGRHRGTLRWKGRPVEVPGLSHR